MTRAGRSASQILACLAGVLVVGLTGHAALSAAERYAKPKPALDGAAIIAALSKLEAQQEEVLRRLDAAKKEVAIIKVRASTIPSGICD